MRLEWTAESTNDDALKRMAKRTGVRSLGWHLLRHTFGSKLARLGAPVRKMQILLGHQTITMTLRYTQLTPSEYGEVIELLEEPVAPRRPGGTQPDVRRLAVRKKGLTSAPILEKSLNEKNSVSQLSRAHLR